MHLLEVCDSLGEEKGGEGRKGREERRGRKNNNKQM